MSLKRDVCVPVQLIDLGAPTFHHVLTERWPTCVTRFGCHVGELSTGGLDTCKKTVFEVS